MDVTAVVDEVRRRGGVVRRSSLPRHAAVLAVEQGRLVVPRAGLVAVPDAPRPLLVAASVGGVLSCASAAQVHGVELLEPPGKPHVTVPRGRHVRRRPGLVLHVRDVVCEGMVTSLSRTAADCARCLPERDAVVVLDAVLRRGVAVEEVRQHLWGRGCGPAREALRRADGRSGSSGESVARLALEDAGLDVVPQVRIPGVGWVDLLVEGRVVVEIDGFTYHSDAKQFAADRRRDARLAELGYRVLRFTWLDVVRDPAAIVATVQRVLALSA
jgi:very-short-patch-repair endonuclease